MFDNKTFFQPNSSLVVGEQYLHTVLTNMLKNPLLELQDITSLLSAQIESLDTVTMPKIMANKNINRIVVLATEGLDADSIRSEYRKNFVCTNLHWTPTMWVEAAAFYSKFQDAF